MKLFIRSQDKEILLEMKNLMVDEAKDSSWVVGTEDYVLGRHKTQERCKEILGEIYGLLENNGRTSDKLSALASGIKNEFICYQMPEE